MSTGSALPFSRSLAHVVVASSDADFRQHVLQTLASAGQPGLEAAGGAEALMHLEQASCAGLILDRRLPDLNADDVVRTVSRQYPMLQVEILDGMSTPAQVLSRAESFDFRAVVRTLRGQVRPVAETSAPALTLVEPPPLLPMPKPPRVEMLPGMVGASDHLASLAELVRMVAARRTTVLLTGETGTGKEVVAQALYQLSDRASRPWVVVNCAAIPEALLESELFGYSRGAFTGAVQSRTGRIHAAHTGTLFLDEIGDMPLQLQSKLLRFLQQGEVQKLGSNDCQRADVRVIAATNSKLLEQVESGAFRRDLYYRLAVFPIELLPLRQRSADILVIADHYLNQLGLEAQSQTPRLSREACALLEAHSWPGNVRELQHTMERAFILAEGRPVIQPAHFPALDQGRLK